ncbi:MAG: hydroxymethylglutaryl-CoA lyase [Bacteroidota bacterium]|nr:hydroxymethylglutaryl-CoA lyase [Bacteroidota bacterium]
MKIANQQIKITECPRDAWQGIKQYISVKDKSDYINTLLKVGFDTIDFGSFVSPKAIPQLKDTKQVIEKLDLSYTNTKLSALVGNLKGAQIASEFEEIDFIAFPFSFSETFLKLNLNTNIANTNVLIDKIIELTQKTNKNILLYIAMAFGNPYGDISNIDLLMKWIEIFKTKGLKKLILTDVTGIASAEDIRKTYSILNKEFPDIEFGLHLHTDINSWEDKIDATWKNGCKSFESVIDGYGGCPMTNYEMIGNLSTQKLLDYCNKNNINTAINNKMFRLAVEKSRDIFPK